MGWSQTANNTPPRCTYSNVFLPFLEFRDNIGDSVLLSGLHPTLYVRCGLPAASSQLYWRPYPFFTNVEMTYLCALNYKRTKSPPSSLSGPIFCFNFRRHSNEAKVLRKSFWWHRTLSVRCHFKITPISFVIYFTIQFFFHYYSSQHRIFLRFVYWIVLCL